MEIKSEWMRTRAFSRWKKVKNNGKAVGNYGLGIEKQQSNLDETQST